MCDHMFMRKTSQILLLAFTFIPGAFGQMVQTPEGVIDCGAVAKEHSKHISGLKSACEKHEECRVDYLDWDSRHPVYHSENEDLVQQLISMQAATHQICKYEAPKSSAGKNEVICMDRKCVSTKALDGISGKKLKLKFSHKGKPLVKHNVPLTYDTGIRCEKAPCDSRSIAKSYMTDDKGMVEISIGEIRSYTHSKGPLNTHVGPDGYAFSIENVGFAMVNFKIFYMDTNKIYEFNF